MQYNEIFRLAAMLDDENIPYEFGSMFDGYHIVYYHAGEIVCSVIEHRGSYGHENDLLEIMGLILPSDDTGDYVKGWLTAENVFERIKNHYETHRRG